MEISVYEINNSHQNIINNVDELISKSPNIISLYISVYNDGCSISCLSKISKHNKIALVDNLTKLKELSINCFCSCKLPNYLLKFTSISNLKIHNYFGGIKLNYNNLLYLKNLVCIDLVMDHFDEELFHYLNLIISQNYKLKNIFYAVKKDMNMNVNIKQIGGIVKSIYYNGKCITYNRKWTCYYNSYIILEYDHIPRKKYIDKLIYHTKL